MKPKTQKQAILDFLRNNPLLTLSDAARVFTKPGKKLLSSQYLSLVQAMEPGLAEYREKAKNAHLEALGVKMRPFRAPEKK